MTSCEFTPGDRSAAVSVADTPVVISGAQFLAQLPELRLPHLAHMGPVPAGFLGLNMPSYFSLKEGGKLPADNGITPVIFSGAVQGRKVIYLFTYDKDGKELSRLQIYGDGFVEKESPAYDEHYKEARLQYDLVADTMIELKCKYYFVKVEKKASFFYHVGADGIISPIAKDTISLAGFAATFPLLETPWRMGPVDMKGLQQVSRLTPYFNFAEVEDDRVYAYGRVELDGLPALLLYGQENNEVNLITYNEKGNMVGSLKVKDSICREGECNYTGNCRINADGIILLDVIYKMDSDGYAFMEKVNMRYAVQASGSIIPEEATQITITSPLFQKERLLKMFRTTAKEYKDEPYKQSLLLSEIPSPDRISANMHFYQHGNECLVELFTRKADGSVADRYQLLNTLNEEKYADVSAKDEVPDAEEYVVEKRGHYTKSVVLKLPGKDLHIDAEGRFVK
jgi:hypothetical protein